MPKSAFKALRKSLDQFSHPAYILEFVVLSESPNLSSDPSKPETGADGIHALRQHLASTLQV